VFPAAAEACDSLDNDCDGMFDEGLDGTREWAVDCDLDGSLAAGTERRLSCTPPPDPPEPCPTGEWIESDGLPEDDCNDAHRDVYAGQTRFFGMGIDGPTTGFDYDCDGMEERQYPPESDRMCFCTPDGACEGTAWIDDPPCGATAMLFDCDGSGCLTPRTTCETTVRCR
jgi:hypothetical protein